MTPARDPCPVQPKEPEEVLGGVWCGGLSWQHNQLLFPFRVNCSFYFKIGACRHGDRCSRLHNKPTFSQVCVLLCSRARDHQCLQGQFPQSHRPEVPEPSALSARECGALALYFPVTGEVPGGGPERKRVRREAAPA